MALCGAVDREQASQVLIVMIGIWLLRRARRPQVHHHAVGCAVTPTLDIFPHSGRATIAKATGFGDLRTLRAVRKIGAERYRAMGHCGARHYAAALFSSHFAMLAAASP